MSAMKPGPLGEEFHIPLDLLNKFDAKPRVVIGGSNGGMVLSREVLAKLTGQELANLTAEFDVLLVNKIQR